MDKIPPQVKFILGALITSSVVYMDPLVSLGTYLPPISIAPLESSLGSYLGGMLAGIDMGNVWVKRFALSSALGALFGSQFGPSLGMDSPMGAAFGAGAGFYGTAVLPEPHPIFNTVA